MFNPEQSQIILASYFRYFGEDAAGMLALFSSVNQHRIVQMFMNIIEDELYKELDDDEESVHITIPVAQDIKKPLRVLVGLYIIDKMSEGTVKTAKNVILNQANF